MWRLWKGRKKVEKIEYLEKEIRFLDEIKIILCNFLNAFFWQNTLARLKPKENHWFSQDFRVGQNLINLLKLGLILDVNPGNDS